MKFNNKKFDYIANFKYLMLVPIVLVFFAIIIGCIFNLNFDYDFRKVNNFTVKFNTTVSESEYKSLENNIKAIVDDSNINDYRIERIGTYAQNGILIRVPNDGKFDEQIVNLKSTIENDLLTKCGEDITSSVVITTTDTDVVLPQNVSKLTLVSSLVMLGIIALVFLYFAIRYNLVAGYTTACGLLLNIVMLTACLITFRVPFNMYFVVPYVVMTLSTVISTMFIFNYVKNTLSLEKYAKTTNKDRIIEANKNSYKFITIFLSIIGLLTLGVMFFGGASLIYVGISILISLLVSLFVTIIFVPSFWSFMYNKDKDKMLQRRIDAENKKKENLPNDKIVV